MKVVGIPGGFNQNVREKRGFPKGLMQKSRKFQGSHDKIGWKSKGLNFEKIDILNRGSCNISLVSPIYSFEYF